MKITEEVQNKINQIAASTFLSEGTYDDLEAAADGDTDAEDRITIWNRFENDDINYVLEKVNDLATDITDLITDLIIDL